MAAGALDGRGGEFVTTHWSLVVQARGSDTTSREALNELIRTYWYPVYAYFRRKTGAPDRAEDLTQGLFTHLLDGGALANLDPGRGRFRSFLIACCENYLHNDNARLAAHKRGGSAVPRSLDLRTRRVAIALNRWIISVRNESMPAVGRWICSAGPLTICKVSTRAPATRRSSSNCAPR